MKESVSQLIINTEGIAATVAKHEEDIKKIADISINEDAIVSKVM
jgi:hypothetical protein